LKKKVITRIFGGLGNQLFCYAVAKKIAIINNAELIIDNISGFEKDNYNRKYLLNNFNIQSRLITKKEILYPFSRYRYSILRRFNKFLNFENRFYIQHEGVDFDKRVLNISIKKKLYLEACWQSENYFHDIKEIIKNEYNLDCSLENLSFKHARWTNASIDDIARAKEQTDVVSVRDMQGCYLFLFKNDFSLSYFQEKCPYIRLFSSNSSLHGNMMDMATSVFEP
jgi:hypothetical protein